MISTKSRVYDALSDLLSLVKELVGEHDMEVESLKDEIKALEDEIVELKARG